MHTRTRNQALAAMVAVAALMVTDPQPLWAQASNPPLLPGLSGSAEVGARSFFNGGLTAQQLGKFQEYKDMPKGAVLEALTLRFSPADSFRSFQLTAHNVGQRDQSYAFRGTQPGRWDLQLRYDGIPHLYSTTARMLGTRTSPDVFSLSGAARGDTNTVNRALDAMVVAGTFSAPERLTWTPFKATALFTPTKAWDSRFEYRRIGKRGERPMGMSFGASPSINSREILEPIGQVMHDVRVAQGYANDRAQFNLQYDLSLFRNDFQSVTSDNPLQLTDITTASSRGRNSLPPNNMAQSILASGAVRLPFRSRVTATAGYSMWRQDQAFIPATINSAVSSAATVAPALAAMPANLGGKAGTSTINLSATSRPWVPLTLSAHYRRYDFRDEAAVKSLPILIINDRIPTNLAPIAIERDPYTKDNSDIGATWRVYGPVAINAALEHEAIDLKSEDRNTDGVAEKTGRVGVNITGNRWASLRMSYTKGWRRNDGYHQVDTTYLKDFRRLDLADRDRERMTTIAELFPVDAVMISATWKIGRDAYPNSQYGVNADRSVMLAGDLDWTPVPRFSMGGGYSREEFRNLFRGRYRSGTLNLAANDWVGNNRDLVTIASAYTNLILIPGKLDAGGSVQFSKSRYLMAAYNPNTLSTLTESQQVGAKAVNFPEITQNYQPLSTFVRWTLNSDWAATARFQAELYSQNDFRTNGETHALIHMFLGNEYRDFNARFLTISVTFRPGVLRASRSTL